jgi:hypothetical protein
VTRTAAANLGRRLETTGKSFFDPRHYRHVSHYYQFFVTDEGFFNWQTAIGEEAHVDHA